MESIKLCQSGWADKDLQSDCKNIKKIASQIDEFIKDIRRKKPVLTNDDFKILIDNIYQVLSKWTGSTWVGQRKQKELSDSFQIFFNQLFRFLIMVRCRNSLGSEMAEKMLYSGRLYRYLGHPSGSDDYDSRIEPEYNDIWVSWSKRDVRTIGYFDSKLFGIKTVLICEVTDKMGIDIGGFDEMFGTHLVRGEESEVVYPTFKDAVIDVIYLGDNDNE